MKKSLFPGLQFALFGPLSIISDTSSILTLTDGEFQVNCKMAFLIVITFGKIVKATKVSGSWCLPSAICYLHSPHLYTTSSPLPHGGGVGREKYWESLPKKSSTCFFSIPQHFCTSTLVGENINRKRVLK